MPTLSDIKLMTRDEAETLISTKEQEAEYLFQGWGSKFKLQNFSQTPSMAAGTYYPDNGYLGFEKVTILQAGHTAELDDKTFTTNGLYTPAEGKDGYRNVTVSVTPNLQNKSLTRAELATMTSITCDSGFDGLGTVTITD